MQLSQALASTVVRVLRPLVRILLRNGVPYGAFAELARWVYVDVARRDFALPGRKQTKTRISVLTGLTRKEVHRLLEQPAVEDSGALERYHRAARVIGGWLRDARFRAPDGAPRPLPVEGEGSFAELVRAYSGDMTPRALLDELERVGAVERDAEGRVVLRTRGYVPAEEADRLAILGVDVADLIATIDHNLQAREPEARRFQRKVMYDNLPAEALPELQRLAREKGQALLEELNAWLAERDRDVNPAVTGTGRKRAGVGVYYFEADYDEEAEDEQR